MQVSEKYKEQKHRKEFRESLWRGPTDARDPLNYPTTEQELARMVAAV